jgi:hypothetical protein
MSSIEIHYRKIRPLDLDSLAKTYEPTDEEAENEYNPFNVSQIQSFNPLYTEFFVLNESNYDRVGLNHQFYMDGGEVKKDKKSRIPFAVSRKCHVKSSPLLDPIHFLVGKYESVASPQLLRTLPNLSNMNDCFPKIANKQNASYIDGFFCYLSSQMMHTHNMLNGIDFYGSYLGLQSIFKATITDDVDYLHQSRYFMDRVGKEFTISCTAQQSGGGFDDFTGIGSRTNKKRLVLEDELSPDEFCIECVNDIAMETQECHAEIVCEYEKPVGVSDDYSVSSEEDMNYSSSDESLKLGSESDTDSDADNEVQMDNEVNEVHADTDVHAENEDHADNQTQEDKDQDDEISEYETDDSSEEEDQEAYAYIKDFPVNLIFLEKCDGTLDRLFMDQEINTEQGAACLMQIVMALLAFQKAFHFTHNDLHTNNVMYVNTDIEWLYYKYENQFYRVPTYGRIFKIIDFGRAIYRFKDRIYCSDSFASKGDAHSQYNTEPYFNENKPRIEPNLSFDLCRLGTSIYDFIIQDEEDERDEFQETIYRWCLDDNGKNVMYKRDGEERYPGFKLYKMIAKNVHAHTPAEQLKFAFFNQFLLEPKDAAMLDETEVRQQGLNIDLIAKEYV